MAEKPSSDGNVVEKIVGNRALKAKEDRVLPKLSAYEQHSYVKLREEAIKIEHRNPNLDPTANTRFVSEYLDAAMEHRRELDNYRLKAKQNGIIPDPGSIAQLSVQMRQKFIDNYKLNTLPSLERAEPERQKGHARKAHAQLMDAMSDETIPEMAAAQFYKKEKGGIQWPGIIGGLVGGLFIFTQMGGMSGGIIGLIATALATLAGAWLVNRGVEKVSNYYNEKKSSARERQQTTEPTRAPAKAPEQVRKPEEKPTMPDVAGAITSDQIGGALPAENTTMPTGIPNQPAQADKSQQKPATQGSAPSF